jgi:hypothetical protein
MKKILLLFSLLLCISLQGQIPRYPFYVAPVVVTGFDGGMISNGNFASGATDWSTEAGWSIGSGVATYNDIDNASALIQTDANMNSSVAINTAYDLSFDIVISSGNANIGVYTSAGHAVYVAWYNNIITASGHYHLLFTTGGNIIEGGISFWGYISSGNSFTITNIRLVLQ